VEARGTYSAGGKTATVSITDTRVRFFRQSDNIRTPGWMPAAESGNRRRRESGRLNGLREGEAPAEPCLFVAQVWTPRDAARREPRPPSHVRVPDHHLALARSGAPQAVRREGDRVERPDAPGEPSHVGAGQGVPEHRLA